MAGQAMNVATMRKLVASYVLMPTDPEVIDLALSAISLAIDKLNTRYWNAAITSDILTFVEGQTDYDMTKWFAAPRRFSLRNPDEKNVARLPFKPWTTFLDEHRDETWSSEPSVYSCPNALELGTVTLDVAPTAAWIAQYPTGIVLYFRRWQHPSNVSPEPLDVPDGGNLFVREFASAVVADSFAVQKAAAAYARANEQFIRMRARDGNVFTDWE